MPVQVSVIGIPIWYNFVLFACLVLHVVSIMSLKSIQLIFSEKKVKNTRRVSFGQVVGLGEGMVVSVVEFQIRGYKIR